MAYDAKLAERIRKALKGPGVTEKEMFGGIGFMVKGRMCVGVIGRDLMARVGDERHDEAVARPHARPMDFTGRPMRGFIYVAPEGVESDAQLKKWVEEARAFATSLPAKKAKKKARPSKR
jgi:TfoX/Sxy family transcriptional regulator of competence genes